MSSYDDSKNRIWIRWILRVEQGLKIDVEINRMNWRVVNIRNDVIGFLILTLDTFSAV